MIPTTCTHTRTLAIYKRGDKTHRRSPIRVGSICRQCGTLLPI